MRNTVEGHLKHGVVAYFHASQPETDATNKVKFYVCLIQIKRNRIKS